MKFIETLINIIVNFGDYILAFFSYLIESANSLLSSGNILIFVLFVLVIWKGVIKLKG